METALVIIALVTGVLALILLTVKLKVHPFFSLIMASFVFAVVSGMGIENMLEAFTAGGFMVFHGNDDFFWVTTSTSEMETSIAYKTLPIASICQSLTALAIVFVLKIIFL